MNEDCARCGHGKGSHLRGDQVAFCLHDGCVCVRYTTRPSAAGVDLPDGTRVKATVEGEIRTAVASGQRWTYGCGVWLESCISGSVVAVPVVPEPGRWYRVPYKAYSEPIYCYALPGGTLLDYFGPNKWAHVVVDDIDGPLVECPAPAEFGGQS